MNAATLDFPYDSTRVSDQAASAIGRLVVACAEFETELTLLMKVVDRSASPWLLPSQKIRAVRDVLDARGTGDVPARRQGRIRIILHEAEKILILRAECAHSTATAALVDGEQRWLLRNAQHAAEPVERCVVVSPEQLRAATARIKQLANQLKHLLNPPLPLQPRQAEATDP